MTKKKSNIIVIIICILLVITLLPIALNFLINPDNNKKDQSIFDCKSCEVEWAQGEMCLQLKSGVLVTNTEIDRIFVNANGYGSQDLEFTKRSVSYENNSVGVEYTLTPVSNLLSMLFCSDTSVTVDIYVVYDEISYKIDSQQVVCVSCWTEFY